ncbi:MAG: zinc ribbon domain-containing protein [Candidatus Micrarchaeaceae archaeon]
MHINFETHKTITMIVMKTAYKYRAYPSKEQKAKLDSQMFLAKNLYNLLLEKSKAYYKETGKTLTKCGNVQEMPLNKRTFICEKCGNKEDRDINASMNILERGISARATEGHSGSQACGDDVRPSAMKAVAEEAGTIRVAS